MVSDKKDTFGPLNKYRLDESPEVEEAVKRNAKKNNKEDPNKQESDSREKIQIYLQRFREILDRKNQEEREKGIKAFKRWAHSKFVIKPDQIPDKWFQNRVKTLKRQGNRNLELTEERKGEWANDLIEDQKVSLNEWIDYFSDPYNDQVYPDWLKYWALREVFNLTGYYRDEKIFKKRKKNTVARFPELNPEALGYTLDWVLGYLGEKNKQEDQNKVEKQTKKELNDYLEESFKRTDLDQEQKEDFLQAVRNLDFRKLYAYAIQACELTEGKSLENIEGEWSYYKQDSNPEDLTSALKGHSTGWCIAGDNIAGQYLSRGPIHIFYSLDDDGNKHPRAVIRMEGGEVVEVRGIGDKQNLDPHIAGVVKEKLKELPGGEKYFKKAKDAEQLDIIEEKYNNNKKKLSQEELRFLYEIDNKIEYFGLERPPRIVEILNQRDKRKDYAQIYDVQEEQVIFDLKDLDQKTKVYIGNETYPVPADTDEEEALRLSDIIGLKADLTNLDKEIKEKLTHWKGDLTDRNTGVVESYDELKTVEGVIKLPNYSFVEFEKLKHVKGDILCDNAEFVIIPELEETGGKISAPKAKAIRLGELKKTGGDLQADNAEIINIEKLEEIGGSFVFKGREEEETNFHDIEGVKFNIRKIGKDLIIKLSPKVVVDALEEVGKDIDLGLGVKYFFASGLKKTGRNVSGWALRIFETPEMEEIGGGVDADNLEKLILKKVKKIGSIDNSGIWNVNIPKAKKFIVPELEYLGGDLLANQAELIEIYELGRIKGKIEAEKVEVLNLMKLKTSGSIWAPSVRVLNAPELEEVWGEINALFCKNFITPKLKKIKDCLSIPNVKFIIAPELEQVSQVFMRKSGLEYNNMNKDVFQKATELPLI